MAQSKGDHGTSLRFSEAARQFARWRAKRGRGDRIPESLWRQALELAAEYGVSQTSSRLRLDYYGLKRRLSAVRQPVGSERQRVAPPAAFLELPALLGASTPCVIEIEEAGGRKLRIQLPGVEAREVMAAIELGLARSR